MILAILSVFCRASCVWCRHRRPSGTSYRPPAFVLILRKPFSIAAGPRIAIATVALLLSACAQWLPLPAVLRFADDWLFDRYTVARASDAPESRILVIDIDETSLASAPWPWPRARLATLIELLLEQRARGVALDILLEKPADAGGDQRIAMLAAHGPLVLAQLFDYIQRPTPLQAGILLAGTPTAASNSAVPATGYLGNHAGLAQSAHVGNIGFMPDADGVLRRIPLSTSFSGRNYPALALALLRCCAQRQGQAPFADGLLRVSFRHRWDAYTVAKAADVLRGAVPAAMVRDRLVLIGSSSLSLGDRVVTPLSPSSAGLLVHAALLSDLLDIDAGQAPSHWSGRWLAMLATLALTALTWHTLAHRSALVNVCILSGAALGWLAATYVIAPHDMTFSPAGPFCSILFLLTAGVPFHWQQAQRRSRHLLSTLRQYVAREVVDELLRSEVDDPLAPRQMLVTTLIADMEGYTSQVETLPVEAAARLTTDFLDCLTRPVLEQHGTLDKYTGDGLVAFWGAPLANPDHADLALDAAQAMLRHVRALSAQRVRQGYAPLRLRIGVESGLAMAGDYGTVFRSIYTAVGDSVNTASRLEQMARDLPHDVIIGSGTAGCCRRHQLRPLGEFLLRGKGKPTALYTLAEAA